MFYIIKKILENPFLIHELCFQADFIKKHKQDVKKYGMFSKYDDTQEFLEKNPFLVCEETANYLVLWCIDLEIEEV